MKESSPLRRVLWFGDSMTAAQFLPTVQSGGFETAELNTQDQSACDNAWAVVLFLTGTPQDRDLAVVRIALNAGVNLVVAARTPELGRDLGSCLESDGIRFSDEAPNGAPDDQQLFRDVPIEGGELRRIGFGAQHLLIGIDRPARIPLSNPDLAFEGEPLDDDKKMLLRRSFSDFRSVRIIRMHGGRLAEAVLAVIPSMGDTGGRPLPYVAKIAKRSEIIREARKFESRVRDYVPFSSRPNFLVRRSFVLASQGILVGQFVERAVSLDTAIRRGTGIGALHELFSSVLHRWWANSFRAGAPPRSNLASADLKRWFDSNEGERERAITYHQNIASRELALEVLPRAGLVARLNAVERRLRRGWIHGDLNCGNVLVREQSSLLIDFSYCAHGPLLADPAWLEVNLVFGWDWLAMGETPENIEAKKQAWHRVVKRLYQPAVLREPLPLDFGEDFDDEMHRLCGAVGIIRRHAFAVSVATEKEKPRDDYSMLITAALVRFASRRDPANDASQRRSERAARAYAAASEIVQTL